MRGRFEWVNGCINKIEKSKKIRKEITVANKEINQASAIVCV